MTLTITFTDDLLFWISENVGIKQKSIILLQHLIIVTHKKISVVTDLATDRWKHVYKYAFVIDR